MALVDVPDSVEQSSFAILCCPAPPVGKQLSCSHFAPLPRALDASASVTARATATCATLCWISLIFLAQCFGRVSVLNSDPVTVKY